MKNAFKILFILLLLLVCKPFHGHAQGTQTQEKPIPKLVDTSNILDRFDENPEPPGGMVGYQQFLSKHIRYPKKALNANAQGTVYISMIVRKDGSVEDIKVKSDKVGYGCAEEAVRVLKLMGKWKPGKMDGKPVNVRYTIPVKFVLH